MNENVELYQKAFDSKRESSLDLGVIQPIAKSTFYQKVILREWTPPGVQIAGWQLVGNGDPYADCGQFRYKGCLNVDLHTQKRIDGIDVLHKAYIKGYKRSCNRAECPTCYESWAGIAAHRIVERIDAARKKLMAQGFKWLKPVHLIVSPPPKIYYRSMDELRRIGYKIAKEVGFVGGCCIVHPFREACQICGESKEFHGERCEKCGSSQFQWYFSPHFHLIGFGWIAYEQVVKAHKRTGWISRDAGVRDSVLATAWYQLGHAGVSKAHHTVTWFGVSAYNKLRVPKIPPELELCPLCGSELEDLAWGGDGDPPVPEREGEYFVSHKGWFRRIGGWSE